MTSFTDAKIEEFREKYGSFELCERITKKDHDRLEQFLTQALQEQRIELLKQHLSDLQHVQGLLSRVGREHENEDEGTIMSSISHAKFLTGYAIGLVQKDLNKAIEVIKEQTK